MNLSVSSLKYFMKTKEGWLGKYILGARDDIKNDSFLIGKGFHHYCQTGQEGEAYAMLEGVEDRDLAIEKLDNLIFNYNSSGIKLTGKNEQFVKGKIFGVDFYGYIDNLEPDLINELKSASKLSNPEDLPASWQSINNYEEYKLQAWVYMKLTGIKKVRLIEVVSINTLFPENSTSTKDDIIALCKDFDEADSKLTKKDIINKYQPRRKGYQIIYFEDSPELDASMEEKYKPFIEEMASYIEKYKTLPSNFRLNDK